MHHALEERPFVKTTQHRDHHTLDEAIEVISALPAGTWGPVNSFHEIRASGLPIVTMCPTTALLLAWFPGKDPWSHRGGYCLTVDRCLDRRHGFTAANIVTVYDAAGGYLPGRDAVIANLRRGGQYESDD